MAGLTKITYQGEVAILSLTSGKTNPLGPALVSQLSSGLGEIAANPGVRALVLSTASPSFFSLGLAVPELLQLDTGELSRFFREFDELCIELLTFPMPTIAAVTGHAVAGGCVVVLCCDYRYLAEGRNLMGLNEIKLGLPVPLPGECALRAVVGERAARQVIDSGEFYEPEDSLAMGLCDRVLPGAEVLPAAVQQAALLGSRPRPAVQAIKTGRLQPLLARLRSESTTRERSFLACWNSEEAQALLTEAAGKF